MKSAYLQQRYINIINTILDVIRRSVFYLKHTIGDV
jgi:hypothetical protein